MSDPLPQRPSYRDLPLSHRLALVMEFTRVNGKPPREFGDEDENDYRRYCGWYLDLNQLGRVFGKEQDIVHLEEWPTRTVPMENASV